MNFSLSFGQTLQINGEDVPAYLEKALLEYLQDKQTWQKVDKLEEAVKTMQRLTTPVITASKMEVSGVALAPGQQRKDR